MRDNKTEKQRAAFRPEAALPEEESLPMCTAVTYQTQSLYCGRNLDYDRSYGESVVVTPRRFTPPHRRPSGPYALIGMGHVRGGYPLYYDAVNEKGLYMAGLNFVGNAVYEKDAPGADNVPQYALILRILSECADSGEACARLRQLRLTDTLFEADLPAAQLHWMLADRRGCFAVESTREGLQIYADPAGVLTNNPPFPQQLFALNNYCRLSPDDPENRWAPELPLELYSRGLGGLGLPGDLSSQSRFIRAAFVRHHSRSGSSEEESVHQMFHILGAVEQPDGCCRTESGGWERTLYSTCCNTERWIYYYTTYEDRQITAVEGYKTDIDGGFLTVYPMVSRPRFHAPCPPVIDKFS